MTGPDHYAEAERLLALAGRHSRGATYDPEWTPALAAAQVHATLALAAATSVGTAGPEGRAWADVAATKPSASEPQAPDARRTGIRSRTAAPSAPLPAGGRTTPLSKPPHAPGPSVAFPHVATLRDPAHHRSQPCAPLRTTSAAAPRAQFRSPAATAGACSSSSMDVAGLREVCFRVKAAAVQVG